MEKSEMTSGKYENLNNLIEKVLFDKTQLDELKLIINQLNARKISPKDVRSYILTQKERDLGKLLELISFFIKSVKQDNSNRELIQKPLDNEVLSELQEKNEFIEKMGVRINSLVNNLNKKTLA